MRLRALFACVALSLASSSSFALFERCLDEFPNRQVPSTLQVGRDLCFDGFAVFYSPQTKKPVYVVERLNRARLQNARLARPDFFYEEARLPSRERAYLSDYVGSGYDRGHNAPAADMSTENAMSQSFSLANVMPQAAQNNRGVWAKSVEGTTRHYVLNRAAGDVFVFTGSVGELARLGRGRVVVPSHLFKLVYDPVRGQAWAYFLENSDDARMRKPISYDEIKQLTQIDFGLPIQ